MKQKDMANLHAGAIANLGSLFVSYTRISQRIWQTGSNKYGPKWKRSYIWRLASTFGNLVRMC